MKEEELRKHAVCSRCKQKIGHTGLPFFWTMTASRYGVDPGAVQRNAGLAEFFNGSALLARVMGPDEDMAHKLYTVSITLCENCAGEIIEILDQCEVKDEKCEIQELS